VISALVAAGALALVGAAGATDDGLWLFPASHGAGTVAAWRAQQGETDDQGSASQALLLERDSDVTDTSAAAHVVGLEGTQVGLIASLAFEHPKDSRCTLTDPRWALFLQGKGGREYEVSLGCQLGRPSSGAEPGWIRRTFARTVILAEVLKKQGTVSDKLTGLALVFDRTVGQALVDNIRVRGKPSNVWTYGGDNGGTTPPGGMPAFTTAQTALLAAPLTADEQLTEDELLGSLTPEEWAQINADAPTQ
jgi:hypothetical protein